MAKKRTPVVASEVIEVVELDFESRVRTNFYASKLPYGPSLDQRVAYRDDSNRLTSEFFADFNAYLLENGVPKKYVAKVANYAWQEGHSSGLYQVLNQSYGLIEIFKE
jgi:hypothetical protein